MAWSHTQPVLWLHNDSGESARFFGISEEGALLAVVDLEGASAWDWEDMAYRATPAGSEAIYLGDIGDNARLRSRVRIYRVPEPAIDIGKGPVTLTISDYDSFELVYPDRAHDAETLLVDPATGDVYILTKESDGHTGVYHATRPADGSRSMMTRVASLSFGEGALSGSRLVTGGDISADGSMIVLRTHDRAFVFFRPPGGTIADAFDTVPARVPAAEEPQGEAIAFSPGGRGYHTISERAGSAVYYVACAVCD